MDFFEEHPILTFVVTFVVTIVVVIFINCIITDARCRSLKKTIYSMGYNAEEAQIFCRRTGANLEDFIASKGLQKQYCLFRDGKTSDFIETAEQKEKENKAHEAGQASGIATGIAAGMAVSSGK